jgi:hypothetical protein
MGNDSLNAAVFVYRLLIEVCSWRFVLAIPEIFGCLKETYN